MTESFHLSLVAAVAENGVIGWRNTLPWKLKGELKLFADITRQHPIIMGRKTFDSLPNKPLVDRYNIVLTRHNAESEYDKDVFYCDTPHKAIVEANRWNKTQPDSKQTIMVIGGAEIYRLFLPMAQQIYYTTVHNIPKGDAWFPSVNFAQDWLLQKTLAQVPADQSHSAYTTELWIRR